MALAAVKPASRLPDLSTVPAVDEVGVNERVARFQSRSIKKASKVEALKLVSRCLLENPEFRPLAEDRERVIELARQANHDELIRQLG